MEVADPYRGAFPLSGLNVTGTGVHAGASSPDPGSCCGNSTVNTSSSAETNDIDIQIGKYDAFKHQIHGGVSVNNYLIILML